MSPRAEIMMTGVRSPSARIHSRSSWPSITGIFRSRITASKRSSESSEDPARPSTAVAEAMPSSSSRRWMDSRMFFSSSTTSTFTRPSSGGRRARACPRRGGRRASRFRLPQREPPADRQADARPPALRREERIEDLLPVLRRNSRAAVQHVDADLAVGAGYLDCDLLLPAPRSPARCAGGSPGWSAAARGR